MSTAYDQQQEGNPLFRPSRESNKEKDQQLKPLTHLLNSRSLLLFLLLLDPVLQNSLRHTPAEFESGLSLPLFTRKTPANSPP